MLADDSGICVFRELNNVLLAMVQKRDCFKFEVVIFCRLSLLFPEFCRVYFVSSHDFKSVKLLLGENGEPSYRRDPKRVKKVRL